MLRALSLSLIFATIGCRQKDTTPHKNDMLGNQAPQVEQDGPDSEDAVPRDGSSPLSCPSFQVALPQPILADGRAFDALVEGRRFANKPSPVTAEPKDGVLTISVTECTQLMTDKYSPVEITATLPSGEKTTFRADPNTNTYVEGDQPTTIPVPVILFQNR